MLSRRRPSTPAARLCERSRRGAPLFKRLFQRAASQDAEEPLVHGHAPALPRGVRVYVVGDIHGRLDLLKDLEARIVADAAEADVDRHVVYLGDYVDRGFESRQVIEHLILAPLPGFHRVLLIGNHDAWLRDFSRGDQVSSTWLQFGGDATMLSYGVKVDLKAHDEQRLQGVRDALSARLPASHRAFLEGLELAFGLGDYYFCHAGVRPGVALGEQSEADLLWIREPFLSWGGDAGKIIVHGHTVDEQPVVRRNRIGIDTGACWTGNLTALVLEGERRRFLSTAQARTD